MENQLTKRPDNLDADVLAKACIDALLQNGSIAFCRHDEQLPDDRFDPTDGLCLSCGLPQMDAAIETARQVLKATINQHFSVPTPEAETSAEGWCL